MKKLLIITCLCMFVWQTKAQENKWRTITLTAMSFQNLAQNSSMTSFSAGLNYQVKNRWWVSSWNQAQINHTNDRSWFATLSTVDYRTDSGWVLGAGYMYSAGSENRFAINLPIDRQSFGVVKLSYRIKLK